MINSTWKCLKSVLIGVTGWENGKALVRSQELLLKSLHDTKIDIYLVFRNKKLLKGSGISVTESLTLKRMEHLKKVREQHGFANVWTLDEKIMFKGNGGNPKVYYS